MITLVLAMAENGVIGRDGTIPWRISEDLKRFKALTVGKTVMMGRKTWDSLPRKPLPDRVNLVVTRQKDWQADGAVRVSSLAEAQGLAGEGNLMVIGGAEIYRAALSRADRIELTLVHDDFVGDAVFDFDRRAWREIAREEHTSEDGLAYSYITLVRK